MTVKIAILPARGGSKRIPRKNIRDFGGKPALAWPLSAARAAGLFERIVVSTDSEEIGSVARDWGAEVPFKRSPDLSDDHAGTTEVIGDAVRRLELPDDALVCCIYPTALFLDPGDLIAGHDLIVSGATWVMSVAEYATPIERAYRMRGTDLVPREPEMMPKRSQDLETAYFDAGQFYWARAATWVTPKARVWDGAKGVCLPHDRAVDIDTESDWARAEQLLDLSRSGA